MTAKLSLCKERWLAGDHFQWSFAPNCWRHPRVRGCGKREGGEAIDNSRDLRVVWKSSFPIIGGIRIRLEADLTTAGRPFCPQQATDVHPVLQARRHGGDVSTVGTATLRCEKECRR